jgi:uncharacterized membrane protein
MVIPSFDISAYLISFALIGGYHLYLRIRLRRDRSYTIQSVNNAARSAWVENIMADEGKEILAVQTLRNSTMAATFLASTAILLIIGVLNLMQKSASGDNVLQALQNGLLSGDNLEQFKLLVLLVTFFWAFFSFSMAVRMYNHVGYLINSSNDKQQFCPTPRYVGSLLNRSGSYYSYGMRAYYLSVPLVFALFNPYYLILASIGLIVALYNIDRAPDTQATKKDIGIRRRAADMHFRFRKKVVRTSGLQHVSEPDSPVMNDISLKTNVGVSN